MEELVGGKLYFVQPYHYNREIRGPVPVESVSTQTQWPPTRTKSVSRLPLNKPACRSAYQRLWLLSDPVEMHSCSRCVELSSELVNLLDTERNSNDVVIVDDVYSIMASSMLKRKVNQLLKLSAQLNSLKIGFPHKHHVDFFRMSLKNLQTKWLLISCDDSEFHDASSDNQMSLGSVFFTLGSILTKMCNILMKIYKCRKKMKDFHKSIEACLLIAVYLRLYLELGCNPPHLFLKYLKINKNKVLNGFVNLKNLSSEISDKESFSVILSRCKRRILIAKTKVDQAVLCQLGVLKDLVIDNSSSLNDSFEEDEFEGDGSARTSVQLSTIKHGSLYPEKTYKTSCAKSTLLDTLFSQDFCSLSTLESTSSELLAADQATKGNLLSNETSEVDVAKRKVGEILSHKLQSMMQRYNKTNNPVLTQEKEKEIMSILYQYYNKHIRALLKDELSHEDSNSGTVVLSSQSTSANDVNSSGACSSQFPSLSSSDSSPSVTGRINSSDVNHTSCFVDEGGVIIGKKRYSRLQQKNDLPVTITVPLTSTLSSVSPASIRLLLPSNLMSIVSSLPVRSCDTPLLPSKTHLQAPRHLPLTSTVSNVSPASVRSCDTPLLPSNTHLQAPRHLPLTSTVSSVSPASVRSCDTPLLPSNTHLQAPRHRPLTSTVSSVLPVSVRSCDTPLQPSNTRLQAPRHQEGKTQTTSLVRTATINHLSSKSLENSPLLAQNSVYTKGSTIAKQKTSGANSTPCAHKSEILSTCTSGVSRDSVLPKISSSLLSHLASPIYVQTSTQCLQSTGPQCRPVAVLQHQIMNVIKDTVSNQLKQKCNEPRSYNVSTQLGARSNLSVTLSETTCTVPVTFVFGISGVSTPVTCSTPVTSMDNAVCVVPSSNKVPVSGISRMSTPGTNSTPVTRVDNAVCVVPSSNRVPVSGISRMSTPVTRVDNAVCVVPSSNRVPVSGISRMSTPGTNSTPVTRVDNAVCVVPSSNRVPVSGISRMSTPVTRVDNAVCVVPSSNKVPVSGISRMSTPGTNSTPVTRVDNAVCVVPGSNKVPVSGISRMSTPVTRVDNAVCVVPSSNRVPVSGISRMSTPVTRVDNAVCVVPSSNKVPVSGISRMSTPGTNSTPVTRVDNAVCVVPGSNKVPVSGISRMSTPVTRVDNAVCVVPSSNKVPVSGISRMSTPGTNSTPVTRVDNAVCVVPGSNKVPVSGISRMSTPVTRVDNAVCVVPSSNKVPVSGISRMSTPVTRVDNAVCVVPSSNKVPVSGISRMSTPGTNSTPVTRVDNAVCVVPSSNRVPVSGISRMSTPVTRVDNAVCVVPSSNKVPVSGISRMSTPGTNSTPVTRVDNAVCVVPGSNKVPVSGISRMSTPVTRVDNAVCVVPSSNKVPVSGISRMSTPGTNSTPVTRVDNAVCVVPSSNKVPVSGISRMSTPGTNSTPVTRVDNAVCVVPSCNKFPVSGISGISTPVTNSTPVTRVVNAVCVVPSSNKVPVSGISRMSTPGTNSTPVTRVDNAVCVVPSSNKVHVSGISRMSTPGTNSTPVTRVDNAVCVVPSCNKVPVSGISGISTPVTNSTPVTRVDNAVCVVPSSNKVHVSGISRMSTPGTNSTPVRRVDNAVCVVPSSNKVHVSGISRMSTPGTNSTPVTRVDNAVCVVPSCNKVPVSGISGISTPVTNSTPVTRVDNAVCVVPSSNKVHVSGISRMSTPGTNSTPVTRVDNAVCVVPSCNKVPVSGISGISTPVTNSTPVTRVDNAVCVVPSSNKVHVSGISRMSTPGTNSTPVTRVDNAVCVVPSCNKVPVSGISGISTPVTNSTPVTRVDNAVCVVPSSNKLHVSGISRMSTPVTNSTPVTRVDNAVCVVPSSNKVHVSGISRMSTPGTNSTPVTRVDNAVCVVSSSNKHPVSGLSVLVTKVDNATTCIVPGSSRSSKLPVSRPSPLKISVSSSDIKSCTNDTSSQTIQSCTIAAQQISAVPSTCVVSKPSPLETLISSIREHDHASVSSDCNSKCLASSYNSSSGTIPRVILSNTQAPSISQGSGNNVVEVPVKSALGASLMSYSKHNSFCSTGVQQQSHPPPLITSILPSLSDNRFNPNVTPQLYAANSYEMFVQSLLTQSSTNMPPNVTPSQLHSYEMLVQSLLTRSSTTMPPNVTPSQLHSYEMLVQSLLTRSSTTMPPNVTPSQLHSYQMLVQSLLTQPSTNMPPNVTPSQLHSYQMLVQSLLTQSSTNMPPNVTPSQLQAANNYQMFVQNLLTQSSTNMPPNVHVTPSQLQAANNYQMFVQNLLTQSSTNMPPNVTPSQLQAANNYQMFVQNLLTQSSTNMPPNVTPSQLQAANNYQMFVQNLLPQSSTNMPQQNTIASSVLPRLLPRPIVSATASRLNSCPVDTSAVFKSVPTCTVIQQPMPLSNVYSRHSASASVVNVTCSQQHVSDEANHNVQTVFPNLCIPPICTASKVLTSGTIPSLPITTGNCVTDSVNVTRSNVYDFMNSIPAIVPPSLPTSTEPSVSSGLTDTVKQNISNSLSKTKSNLTAISSNITKIPCSQQHITSVSHQPKPSMDDHASSSNGIPTIVPSSQPMSTVTSRLTDESNQNSKTKSNLNATSSNITKIPCSQQRITSVSHQPKPSMGDHASSADFMNNNIPTIVPSSQPMSTVTSRLTDESNQNSKTKSNLNATSSNITKIPCSQQRITSVSHQPKPSMGDHASSADFMNNNIPTIVPSSRPMSTVTSRLTDESNKNSKTKSNLNATSSNITKIPCSQQRITSVSHQPKPSMGDHASSADFMNNNIPTIVPSSRPMSTVTSRLTDESNKNSKTKSNLNATSSNITKIPCSQQHITSVSHQPKPSMTGDCVASSNSYNLMKSIVSIVPSCVPTSTITISNHNPSVVSSNVKSNLNTSISNIPCAMQPVSSNASDLSKPSIMTVPSANCVTNGGNGIDAMSSVISNPTLPSPLTTSLQSRPRCKCPMEQVVSDSSIFNSQWHKVDVQTSKGPSLVLDKVIPSDTHASPMPCVEVNRHSILSTKCANGVPQQTNIEPTCSRPPADIKYHKDESPKPVVEINESLTLNGYHRSNSQQSSVNGQVSLRRTTPGTSTTRTSVLASKLMFEVTVIDHSLLLKWNLTAVNKEKLEQDIEYYDICYAKLQDESHFTYDGCCSASWTSMGVITPLLLPMSATLANLHPKECYVFFVKGVISGGTKMIFSDIKFVEIM